MDSYQFMRQHGDAAREALHGMAAEHVARSAGKLALLEKDHHRHRAQRLTTFRLKGNPVAPAIVESIAGTAERRFPDMLGRLDAEQARTGHITHIGELLKKDQNVVILTNHGDTIDIALALAAYYDRLKTADYQFKTAMTISKIIPYMGYDFGGTVAPTTDVLEMLCDDTYLSFPRTPTMEQGGIPEPAVTAYNARLRQHYMARRLAKGNTLFGMAGSGTTDKPVDGDPGTMRLGELQPGTIKLLTARNTLVQPVAVWLKAADVVFEPIGVPLAVNTTDEAHGAMAAIRDRLDETVPDTTFLYDAA